MNTIIMSSARVLSSRAAFAALIAVVSLAFAGGIEPSTVRAAPSCVDGAQTSGAIYRICMPAGTWNRELIVWAHGFVKPQNPVEIPEDQLVFGDISYPQLATDLGFAFATTSYRKNGLVILDGIEDLKELVGIFVAAHGQPRKTYMTGGSEGGIIATLAVEQNPFMFNGGGIAACGPVGDFPQQMNYMGDTRVLFDYFFPGVLPGNPLEVPQSLIDTWETAYQTQIRNMLLAQPSKLQQIMRAGKIPDQGSDADDARAVVRLLWYNVKATNDAVVVLKGKMYDNRTRWYTGSDNDFQLNTQVQRFTPEPAAVQEMRKYQTSGRLLVPLITLHTTGDPEVPYFHEPQYSAKSRSSQNHINIPIFKPGHCNFNEADVLLAVIMLSVLTW